MIINTRLFEISTEYQTKIRESFRMLIDKKILILDQEIEDTVLYVVDWESESDSESGGFNNPQ